MSIDNPLTTLLILASCGLVGFWLAKKLELNFDPPPDWRLPVGEVFLFVWLLFGIAMAALTGRLIS